MALLSELFVNIKADAKGFKTGITEAKQGLKQFTESIKKNQAAIQNTGKAFLAFSAALTGAIAFNVKQASDAEKTNALLANSLKNIGEESAEANKRLQDLASSIELTSGFGDEELKVAMTDLTNITGDYNVSLMHTKTVADLARASQIDLRTAARVAGMAFIGQTGMLTRYGLKLEKGMRGMEALEFIQKRFAGASDTFMDTFEGQWELFIQSISDVGETLGKSLLPALTDFFTNANETLQGLAAMDKQMAANIATTLSWTAGILGAAGGLLYFTSKVPAIITSLNLLNQRLFRGS